MKLSKNSKAELKDSPLYSSNFGELLFKLEDQFSEITQEDLIQYKYCVAEPLCQTLYTLGEMLMSFYNAHPKIVDKGKGFDWKVCIALTERIHAHTYKLSYIEGYTIARQFISDYILPSKK